MVFWDDRPDLIPTDLRIAHKIGQTDAGWPDAYRFGMHDPSFAIINEHISSADQQIAEANS